MRGEQQARTAEIYQYLAEHPELFSKSDEVNIHEFWKGVTTWGVFSETTKYGDTVTSLSNYVNSYKKLRDTIRRSKNDTA